MATYNFIDSTGLIVTDTSTLLTEVEDEYKDVFGDDFIVDPGTPEGALISAEATSRASVANNNAALANQINPNYAGGVFLDAIYALTGGARSAGERSTVAVDITGVANTVIPVGATARTTAGDEFTNPTALSIGVGGTVSGTFQSVEIGAIGAPVGTLTTIVDNIIGWETITNPTAAVVGSNQQSDNDVRTARNGELALQGRSLAEAVASNVSAVEGVTSLVFRENPTAVATIPPAVAPIALAPHSVWAVVQGGVDEDVANALYEAKSAGAAWNGSESVDVTDQSSGQTSEVLFDRPTEIPMLARVTVRADNTSTVDPTPAVKSAIVDYANGDIEGESGFIVGNDVSPFELAGAVNIQSPEVYVTLLEIAYDDPVPAYVTATLVIELNEIATILETDIQVVLV